MSSARSTIDRLHPFTIALAVASVSCVPNDGSPNNADDVSDQEAATCEREVSDSCAVLSGDEDVDGVRLDESCYQIEGELVVDEGTLEVAPGTALFFHENAGLSFEETGAIVAEGEADNPVCFLGRVGERGHWKGLRFQSESEGRIAHGVVEHAGSEPWDLRGRPEYQGGLVVTGSQASLSVSDSAFRHNEEAAITAQTERTPGLTVESSTFEENAAPIKVQALVAGGLADDLEFSGNDEDRVTLNASGRQKHVVDTDVSLAGLDVPYFVEKGIHVDAGVWTIEAGATLIFAEDQGIKINDSAALAARGTEDAPVHFLGADERRGTWLGLHFTSDSPDNLLDHVVFEHAGSNPWTERRQTRNQGGVVAVGSDTNLTITNSKFADNAHAAIMATDSPDTTVVVENSRFERNESTVVFQIAQIDNIDPGLEVEGNDVDGVVVHAAGTGPRHYVTSDSVWPAFDVPYLVATTIRVEASVEVEPGAVFEFAEGEGIHVEGALTAAGTADEPIIFRGSEPVAGHWGGIYFTGTHANELSNVEIRHGGGHHWDPGRDATKANVVLASSGSGTCGGEATVDIYDATIADSELHGIAIRHGSLVTTCNGIEFDGNAGHDVLDHRAMENDPEYSEAGGCFCETGCECES